MQTEQAVLDFVPDQARPFPWDRADLPGTHTTSCISLTPAPSRALGAICGQSSALSVPGFTAPNPTFIVVRRMLW